MTTPTQTRSQPVAAHMHDGLILPLRTHVRVHLNDSIVIDSCNEHFEISGPDHQAKAEQIRRACNAHHALVKALENLLTYGENNGYRDTEENTLWTQARAALQAAKEGQS